MIKKGRPHLNTKRSPQKEPPQQLQTDNVSNCDVESPNSIYYQRTEKAVEHNMTLIKIIVSVLRPVSKGLEKTSGIEDQWKNGDLTDQNIVEIHKNT